MLKELRKNKMSVVATGILFGVMGGINYSYDSSNYKNIECIIPKTS